MKWDLDETTRTAAEEVQLPIRAEQPSSQCAGGNCQPAKWEGCLRPDDRFAQPDPNIHPNAPSQIISAFERGNYLPALALTVSWGGMWRTRSRIYGTRSLQQIHDTLNKCAQSIKATESVQESWQLLTAGLNWSSVMTSKTLHFLTRATGFEARPPVPIDNAIVRQRLWPHFIKRITDEPRPKNWNGDSFDAYRRYMTAIITWAHRKHWTTTQIESTIFEEFRKPK